MKQNTIYVNLIGKKSEFTQEPNANLFSNVDREEIFINNGIVYEVKNTTTYKDAYLEIIIVFENADQNQDKK